MTDLRRRLRGAFGNVIVWGIGWAVLGFATQIVLRLTRIFDAPVSVSDAAIVGLNVGIGGGIAGAAFSAFIAWAYRDRRIQEISWLKFGVGGAIVTAASITAFIQGASLLGGGKLVEWQDMDSTLTMFSVFGFAAAAASMKVAQSAGSRAPHGPEVPLDDEGSMEPAVIADAVPLEQYGRAKVTARTE